MGLRGLPDVQGGVETHVQKLAPRLVSLGCDVEVLGRTGYQTNLPEWSGVRITSLWAPKAKSLEAVIHSLICVLYAGLKRPDVLHIHAIGPSLVTPLARLLGLKVVVTHHGPDYDRQKWGSLGKAVLRVGECLGMRFSTARIAISPVIRELIAKKYRRPSFLIPNGVDPQVGPLVFDRLDSFGLAARRYVLIVSRLVPEKRHLDLINAFNLAGLPEGWKLAIVGGADHVDDYASRLIEHAKHCPAVVMTGQQSGETLRQLYQNAALFVLPSSHEGLPIALLEAISHQLPVIASGIPANRAVGLSDDCYFPLGDVDAAAKLVRDICTNLEAALLKAQEASFKLMPLFDWGAIAGKTLEVYRITSTSQLRSVNPRR